MNQLRFVSIPWQSARYRQAVDLRHRVLRLPLGLGFSTDDLASEQFQTHFAALIDDGLVGCLIVEVQSDATVKLRQMAVEPTHQRAGIGTFLVQSAENELIQQKVSVIKLHARKTAIGFYQKLGYHPQGKEFVEVTLPHVLMTKQLRTSWVNPQVSIPAN
jgi:GNAT superfamily N-acetyltransferase